jgi:murein DD-endopeptidase MepM/ murein hydrolase activator NlpD
MSRFLRKHGWWLTLILVIDLVLVGWWLANRRAPTPPGSVADIPPAAAIPPEPVRGILVGFPTPQTRLNETNSPDVFMPTGSGRIESSWFGSYRTRKIGSRYLPVFHEGIDIGPVERDRAGRALDDIYAVADGEVGYINRIGGNSSYGLYVVLLHPTEAGEIYTLYSHLASVPETLREGQRIERGDVIGRMGHSSTLGIPRQRSHLHLEYGLVLNQRFPEWFRREKLKPSHGVYHGYNLGGLDPGDLFPHMLHQGRFDVKAHLLAYPAAIRLVVRAEVLPDFYRRYPDLWMGDPFTGEAFVMEVSEGEAPLRARAATPDETARLGRKRAAVLDVQEDILGRNGKRIVVKRSGEWQLGRSGERLLDILLYR